MEKEIITYCTISPILFANTGVQEPPILDLTVTTATHVQSRWVFASLEDTVTQGRIKEDTATQGRIKEDTATQGRIKVEPKKSMCFVLNKRIISQIIGGPIVNNPIKCLGNWHGLIHPDKGTQASWLKKEDKSGLPGQHKCWIYQHAILPRLNSRGGRVVNAVDCSARGCAGFDPDRGHVFREIVSGLNFPMDTCIKS